MGLFSFLLPKKLKSRAQQELEEFKEECAAREARMNIRADDAMTFELGIRSTRLKLPAIASTNDPWFKTGVISDAAMAMNMSMQAEDAQQYRGKRIEDMTPHQKRAYFNQMNSGSIAMASNGGVFVEGDRGKSEHVTHYITGRSYGDVLEFFDQESKMWQGDGPVERSYVALRKNWTFEPYVKFLELQGEQLVFVNGPNHRPVGLVELDFIDTNDWSIIDFQTYWQRIGKDKT